MTKKQRHIVWSLGGISTLGAVGLASYVMWPVALKDPAPTPQSTAKSVIADLTIKPVGIYGSEVVIDINTEPALNFLVICGSQQQVGKVTLSSIDNDIAFAASDNAFTISMDYVNGTFHQDSNTDGNPTPALFNAYEPIAMGKLCSEGKPLEPALVSGSLYLMQSFLQTGVTVIYHIDNQLPQAPFHEDRHTTSFKHVLFHKRPTCG